MSGKPAYTDNAAEVAIHHYYTKILNLVPYLVYWVDESCKLQGFNANFGDLLNILSPDECEYNPYSLLAKNLNLDKSCAESLKLADMRVIFSGKSEHQQPLARIQNSFKAPTYIVHRNPISNENGEIIGAVISIIENKLIFTDKPKTNISNLKFNGSLNKPKVLIVEDNLTAQKVESAIFTSLNCEVDLVQTSEEALNTFQPGKYSLVIMDIGLEDSSGYIIARDFRKIEKESKFRTAIIALTSYKPENVKVDCDFYEMEGVIEKPLTESQASQIIDHFIFKKGSGIDGFN